MMSGAPFITRIRLQCLPLFLFLIFSCPCVLAQKTDSLKDNKDSAKSKANVTAAPAVYTDRGDSAQIPKPKIHSPKKALLYSALLPGLGQAYNHKYWKIPIIYAGLGVMTYFIITNNQQYTAIQNALEIRNNGGIDQYQQYSTVQLTTLRDQWHYNRDLSVIGATFVYVLNLVDAEVDAQFFNFNMSDDISAHFTPTINPIATLNGFTAAPSLTFTVLLK